MSTKNDNKLTEPEVRYLKPEEPESVNYLRIVQGQTDEKNHTNGTSSIFNSSEPTYSIIRKENIVSGNASLPDGEGCIIRYISPLGMRIVSDLPEKMECKIIGLNLPGEQK